MTSSVPRKVGGGFVLHTNHKDVALLELFEWLRLMLGLEKER